MLSVVECLIIILQQQLMYFEVQKWLIFFSTFDIRITIEPVAQYDKFQNVIWAAFSHEYSNSHFPSTSAREDGSLDFPRL